MGKKIKNFKLENFLEFESCINGGFTPLKCMKCPLGKLGDKCLKIVDIARDVLELKENNLLDFEVEE